MKIVTAGYSPAAFFAKLKEVEKRALLLDYDGTLAPFRLRPEDAVPYPGLRKRLNQFIESGHTRTVVITGRPIPALIPLLKLERTPEIWGTHGLERLQPDGTYSIAQPDEKVLEGLEEAQQWIESEKLEIYCERKIAGIAVHTRGLGNALADEIAARIMKGLSHISTDTGLVLQRFDGGVELRVKGVDKGFALTTVLDELGKNGLAAYLGDDLTDEDAFRAIKGRGTGVLVRNAFRPTSANLWLKPPEELLEFLDGWLQALGGKT